MMNEMHLYVLHVTCFSSSEHIQYMYPCGVDVRFPAGLTKLNTFEYIFNAT